MKFSEMKDLSVQELLAKKAEFRKEAFQLRLQQQTGTLEKPSELNNLRKSVARVETALSNRK